MPLTLSAAVFRLQWPHTQCWPLREGGTSFWPQRWPALGHPGDMARIPREGQGPLTAPTRESPQTQKDLVLPLHNIPTQAHAQQISPSATAQCGEDCSAPCAVSHATVCNTETSKDKQETGFRRHQQPSPKPQKQVPKFLWQMYLSQSRSDQLYLRSWICIHMFTEL